MTHGIKFSEQQAMRRALQLALGGWGRAAPNPLVGAVLLKDGQVVGEGFHAGFGEPHAEVVALRTSAAPRGATLVLNLEPCAHQGKTAPCVKAIIEAGVKRVVIAVRDPNPAARGGVEALTKAAPAAAASAAPAAFCSGPRRQVSRMTFTDAGPAASTTPAVPRDETDRIVETIVARLRAGPS